MAGSGTGSGTGAYDSMTDGDGGIELGAYSQFGSNPRDNKTNGK